MKYNRECAGKSWMTFWYWIFSQKANQIHCLTSVVCFPINYLAKLFGCTAHPKYTHHTSRAHKLNECIIVDRTRIKSTVKHITTKQNRQTKFDKNKGENLAIASATKIHKIPTQWNYSVSGTYKSMYRTIHIVAIPNQSHIWCLEGIQIQLLFIRAMYTTTQRI